MNLYCNLILVFDCVCAKTLPVVYSALHQNILDTMHGAGVEIMSPHIEARRDNLPLQIPREVESCVNS